MSRIAANAGFYLPKKYSCRLECKDDTHSKKIKQRNILFKLSVICMNYGCKYFSFYLSLLSYFCEKTCQARNKKIPLVEAMTIIIWSSQKAWH